MNKRSAPTVGASSLLVIFAVLCLTVFAMLSLSTVQADKRLSDRSAAAALGYYEADTEAEEIFARLRAGELPDGVTVTTYAAEEDAAIQGNLYSYTCTISETQAIQVELAEQNGVWTVLRWQAVSTTEWEADDSVDIWDGDGIF